MAKVYFKKAIETEPSWSYPCFALARLLKKDIKNYKESELYFLKCLEIDGKREGMYGEYGYLLYLIGRYSESMDNIKIEIQSYDQNGLAYCYQGLVYKTMGKERMAERCLLKAVELIAKRYKKHRIIRHLCNMKLVESVNMDYLDRFERMIVDKFKYYVLFVITI